MSLVPLGIYLVVLLRPATPSASLSETGDWVTRAGPWPAATSDSLCGCCQVSVFSLGYEYQTAESTLAETPQFRSRLYHLWTAWHWGNYWTSLVSHFPCPQNDAIALNKLCAALLKILEASQPFQYLDNHPYSNWKCRTIYFYPEMAQIWSLLMGKTGTGILYPDID